MCYTVYFHAKGDYIEHTANEENYTFWAFGEVDSVNSSLL